MFEAITIAGGLTGASATPATIRPSVPPILFVHGMFGGAWQFEGWQRYFAGLGYPSVSINLRGRPGSRGVASVGRVSVREYVRDALDAACAMGRPVVIGHSMGGLLAQKLAEADAVRAAVLLCAAPPRGIIALSPALVARLGRYLPALLASRPFLPTPADAAAIIFNRVPAAEQPALRERMVPESGRAARELALGTVAVDERRVRCPVLSVTASEDRFLVPRIGLALARKYGAAHHLAEGHGHYLLAEPGWEAVAAEVARWLGTVGHG